MGVRFSGVSVKRGSTVDISIQYLCILDVDKMSSWDVSMMLLYRSNGKKYSTQNGPGLLTSKQVSAKKFLRSVCRAPSKNLLSGI